MTSVEVFVWNPEFFAELYELFVVEGVVRLLKNVMKQFVFENDLKILGPAQKRFRVKTEDAVINDIGFSSVAADFAG